MKNSRKKKKNATEFLPEIRRGRLGRLTIYEVSESELEILAKGSPSSIYLNFAIFLFTIFISFFTALLTTTIDSIKVFVVFVLIAALGVIGGAILIAVWVINRRSASDIINKIKKRLPPEGIQEKKR